MQPVIHGGASRLPVQRLCHLASIARSSYYRKQSTPTVASDPEATRLRQELHAVCAESPSYGYRRATRELRRRGFCVGRKRIRTLMHKENLRCRRKKRWIHTTDSRHGYRIYPNRARDIVLQRPDQLWVADITYIRLVYEFVYLAVILDAFSRRAVGWALSRHIDTSLTLAALQNALQDRRVMPGLVHHSDRGAQYASTDYVALLSSHGITVSMSRKGNPYDNAKVESFMKTVKTEEVYISNYETFAQAKEQINHFIGIVYNTKRLHSALDYRPPAEFEASYFTTPFTLATGETVSN
jgi:putative transposase